MRYAHINFEVDITDIALDRSRCSKEIKPDCKTRRPRCGLLSLTEVARTAHLGLLSTALRRLAVSRVCPLSRATLTRTGLASTDTTPEGFLYDVGGYVAILRAPIVPNLPTVTLFSPTTSILMIASMRPCRNQMIGSPTRESPTSVTRTNGSHIHFKITFPCARKMTRSSSLRV